MKNSDLPAKIKREKDLLMEWWTSKDTFDRGKYDVISQSSFKTAWCAGKPIMHAHLSPCGTI
jgi:hypothetical protein